MTKTYKTYKYKDISLNYCVMYFKPYFNFTQIFKNFADEAYFSKISRGFNFADDNFSNFSRDLISRITMKSAKFNPREI